MDKAFEVTKLYLNQKSFRTGEVVRIFLGRSGTGMDFSEYLELPQSLINKVQKSESGYNLTTIERRDRLSGGAFNTQTKLAVDIISETSILTVQDTTQFKGTGLVKINNEFIAYQGISGNNLFGATRGMFGSTPANHKQGDAVFEVTDTGNINPLNLLASILVSKGGGGVYDVLNDGAGIPDYLVDIDQIETIRDEFFSSYLFNFKLWGIESLQKFIEDEIFYPLGVRLRTNNNAKIGLAVMDRNILDIESPILSNANIVKDPTFSVDDNKIENRLRVFWDWSDAKGDYLKVSEFENQESISLYGAKKFFELKFKGPRSLPIVKSIANHFLARFSHPRPEISVTALNSTSILNIGDKTELFSDRIPTEQGDLDFGSSMEIIKKSYNPSNGTVQFQLSFTSFSGIRQCFIAPSDTVLSFSGIDKVITVGAGRGAYYRKGWRMRLYDNTKRNHVSSQINEIASISGDVITFKDSWKDPSLVLATQSLDILITQDGVPLVAGYLNDYSYKIMFADYDDVTDQQKKFCFISNDENNFNDNKPPYRVTYA